MAGYRAFSSFLLGHLLLESSTRGADLSPVDVLADGADGDWDGLADYPTLRRLRGGLSLDRGAVEFEQALELLTRLEVLTIEEAES